MIDYFRQNLRTGVMLFSICVFCFFSFNLQAIDSTGASPIAPSGYNEKTQAKKLEKQIMCAFEEFGIAKMGPTVQRQRAMYMAEHLSNLFVRLVEPAWQELATQHLLAQMLSETGSLKHVTELKSSYASSWKRYKGRGGCQTTHLANYAKLAGCTDTILGSSQSRISWDKISAAPGKYRSSLVLSPVRAMDEQTEMGRLYNAMSCPCYFIDTAVRHPKFMNALRCAEQSCIDEVGVALNRGPGKLGQGRLPLNYEERRDAFKKISPCFNSKRDPWIGV